LRLKDEVKNETVIAVRG